MIDFTQKYTRSAWQSFLEDSFLPDDFKSDEKEISFSETLEYTQTVIKLGESACLGLTVFEITHKSKDDARVGLSKDAFRLVYNYTFHSRALVLFVPQNNGCAPNNADVYRFSLVEFTPIDKGDGKVTRDYSNPRRYSFLLGPEAKVKTPQQYLVQKGRVKDVADLRMRFSVEVLTKEFYGGLFKWYDDWAIKEAAFPEGVGASAKLLKGEENRIHLIRLITRLIFVWFIKQKALIPEWIFDKGEVAKVLKTFKSDSLVDGAYYNGIIQNLFFATLNKPTNERGFANVKAGERREDYGIKTVYRDTVDGGLFKIGHDEFISRLDPVPFLNGGLFECLDNFDDKSYVDGFSREKNRCAFVPNALFWGDGERLGIIELFNLYNFTVEENTPQDVDVALDPELLGKVFENLLGTFNPETLDTARNATGSFYTPREIVSYMVDSSLKEYFKNYLKGDADAEEKLEALFSYQDEGHSFSSEQVEALIAAINNSKILDPACGSGAFPMGILQRLVHILGKLDPGNKLWEEIQRKKAVEETEEAYKIGDTEKRNQRLLEISDIFQQNSNDYGRKLFLIENCIYGIDIQPIAIQISKLRFFISLIVNQEKGKNKDDNYGIRPLPNLETKFVAANTLIGLDKAAKDALALQDDTLEALQSELLEIRHQHFIAKTAKEKLSLRKRDKELCNKIMKYVVQNAGKPDENFILAAANEIKNKKNEIKNLPEIWEDKAAESKLFEEQIDHTLFRVDKNKENRDKLQSDIIRLKEAIKMENEKSVPKGFDNEITKTLNWNPYNQNKSSPFFDPFWMFCVKDGFDVVVGNPPYVDSETMTNIGLEWEREYIVKNFNYISGNWDIYMAFFEKGLNLSRNVLCYITPDKWLSRPFGAKFRKFCMMPKMAKILHVGSNVFENVRVDGIVSLFISNSENLITLKFDKNKNIQDVCNVSKNEIEPPYFIDYLFSENSHILDEIDAHCCKTIIDCSECEGACATSDAYDLLPLVENLYPIDNEHLVLINTGTIEKYAHRWGRKNITYLGKKLLHPVVSRQEFIETFGKSYIRRAISPKLIFKGLNLLDACIDFDGNVIPGKSTLVICSKDKLLLKFLCAIINSKLSIYYIKTKYASSSYCGGITFTKDMINKFPIPNVTLSEQQPIIELVDQILEAKGQGEETAELEAQIDEMVYLLYGLTEEEIKVVEGKTK